MNKYIYVILLFLTSFVFGQNKTGINTDDPKATLDVNGNVIVGKVQDYASGNYDLMWNEDDKRIVGLKEQNPFTKITFRIGCTTNQDWIEDFNTKIPTSEYTLIVLNSNLRYANYDSTPGSRKPNNGGDWDNDWDTFYGISHLGNDTYNNDASETVNPEKVVKAFKKLGDENWHLSADYYAASPELAYNVYYGYQDNPSKRKNMNLYWQIDVLAIHNSYIKDFRQSIVSPFGYENWPTQSNNYTTEAPNDSPVINEILDSVD